MAEEEIIEQEQEQEQEPIIINTYGKWKQFENITGQMHEVGHTYKITVQGDCLLAISPEKPTAGIKTNELTYTKDDVNKLWIMTKGE